MSIRLKDVLNDASKMKMAVDVVIDKADGSEHIAVVSKLSPDYVVALCGRVGADDEHISYANARFIAHVFNVMPFVVATLMRCDGYFRERNTPMRVQQPELFKLLSKALKRLLNVDVEITKGE